VAEVLPVEVNSPEPEEENSTLVSPKSSKSKSNSVMEGLYFGEVEQSFQESAYVPDTQKKPYNPDPLVMQDHTYGIYEKMIGDDQVKAALQVKKDLVVGSGWNLLHEEEDVTKELEAILNEETERPFTEMLMDIIQAYEFGFSLSEKLFKKLSDGRLALRDIKPRHPASWLIHTDDRGNVFRYEQRGRSESVDVPSEALIHYVNEEKHQNPYGSSDLYPAYQAWVTKRHITRFYAIFLENAAGPKPIAKYDRRAPAVVVEELHNSIKQLQTKTALTIPKEFEMEYLETSNSGDPYIKGINLFNMFIGRAMLVPDLLGLTGGETGGGSFALGSEQIGVFYKHIYRRREVLERHINQHIIRPLCVFNYGLMEEYPKFKFNPLSEQDAIKNAETWIKGVQGAGWQPTPEEVNHFKSLIKFPESDVVDFPQAPAPGSGFGEAPEAGEFGEEPEEGMAEEEGTEGKEETDTAKKEFAYKLGSLPGDYKNKVNFKLADQNMRSTVSKILAEAKPLIEEMYEDLFDQLQAKKIIQSQKIERAETLKLKNLSKIKGILKKHFRRLHGDAAAQAATEVKKGEFAQNIPADEFLEFLEQETFKFIGDWSYGITKKTKDELIKAIKDGMPLSSVTSVLDEEGQKLTEVALERYARTKSTEVFNKGRMEYFNSTGIVEAYQFSAILDDVTSEICGSLHGLTFPKDDAPIPPLHFNCRSVLIPITRFEDWSQDKVTNGGENVDKFLEKNVTDKGFSVYGHHDDCCEPKKKVEHKRKYKVGDPEVEHDTECKEKQDIITYHVNGTIFQETYVYYEDEKKQKIVAVNHKRFD
jgi:SPP1 gp7 family putative phage head morphogenesis protein